MKWGVASLLLVAAASATHADYPERPIRIIVPFSPGGGTDLTSRLLSQRMTEAFGKQVVVENRPGGAGNIGTEQVARAPADGYTLLMATLSTAVNVSLFKKLPFDPLKSFEPIGLMTTVPLLWVVQPSLPVTNVNELLAMAKAKPGGLNYGSGGMGTANHVAGELLNTLAGVKLTHVPYKGGGPALADVAGGHLHMIFATMTSTRDLAKSGRVRALATTGAARSPSWPELPTVAESGVPGFEVSAWYGLMAPAGTARPIVERWSAEVARMLRVPEVRTALLDQGNEPVGSTPDEFARHLRAEIEKWARVAREARIQAE